jgi:hypothetical protein
MHRFTSRALASLLSLLLYFHADAQDKIYTKTQKTPIEGEVVEISVNEIKYKPYGRPYPVVSMDKQDVIKIVYQSGETLLINNPMKDFAFYNDQHKWNAKLSLFSPLNGHLQLFLEQSVKPGRSREYELNLIGVGKDPILNDTRNNINGEVTYDARGIGLGYGLKVLPLPDYVNGQLRLRHILQGSYIKPSISLAVYSRNFVGSDVFSNPTVEKKMVYAANANVTFGKQWILDNTFSLEVYGLIGYGIDNVRTNQQNVQRDARPSQSYLYDDNTPFNGFGYTRFSKGDFGLSMGLGLRVGYLFDWKKTSQRTPVKN